MFTRGSAVFASILIVVNVIGYTWLVHNSTPATLQQQNYHNYTTESKPRMLRFFLHFSWVLTLSKISATTILKSVFLKLGHVLTNKETGILAVNLIRQLDLFENSKFNAQTTTRETDFANTKIYVSAEMFPRECSKCIPRWNQRISSEKENTNLPIVRPMVIKRNVTNNIENLIGWGISVNPIDSVPKGHTVKWISGTHLWVDPRYTSFDKMPGHFFEIGFKYPELRNRFPGPISGILLARKRMNIAEYVCQTLRLAFKEENYIVPPVYFVHEMISPNETLCFESIMIPRVTNIYVGSRGEGDELRNNGEYFIWVVTIK